MHIQVTIVEDEPSHAILMEYHLKKIEAKSILYHTGQSFLDNLNSLNTDLLIISDQLHDISVPSLLEQLETKVMNGNMTVMIMSTGRQAVLESSKYDIIYCYKPFSVQEFRKKVLSVLPKQYVSSN
ncbi:response regulator transcription factor [Halalkalibacter urbisdiaboli]|uniref:response regulator transcription factor n=1 Tax=Halalkalibacter urbisdiaboli TaxID=1960589 RepID=UPI000B42DBDA|nr:response regulator transcription factor [Halalkalibacter urbisdiaboli]